MLTRKQITSLYQEFTICGECVEEVHERNPHDVNQRIKFLCHHNAYLLAKFMKQRGYDCRFASGHYRCNPPTQDIHHSWAQVNADDKPAVILEFDACQLIKGGGYEQDLMRCGTMPEFQRVAMIVAPELVELPDNADDFQFIVPCQEVFNRYVQYPTHKLDVDFDHLDELAKKLRTFCEDKQYSLNDSDND